MNRPTQPQPRYVVKWNNGAWKVFDLVQYQDTALCHLQKEAAALAFDFNLSPARAHRR